MPPRPLLDFAASRVRALQPSPTLAVTERVRALRRSGVEVIDLASGDPDFPTPVHIRQAATAAIEAGDTHYVTAGGLPELRAAIAAKLASDNGVQVDPDGEVLVTAGGKAALFEAMQALVEPGTEVLILEPSWVSFAPMVQLSGGTPVPVRLSADDGFRLTAERLAAAISPRTRILLVNSPNNPTGRVFDEAEWKVVREAAVARDLLVFSDEIYEKILFDGRAHLSPASFPELAGRTLTFNGFSKAYAMTGWRLGYVAGPRALLSQIAKVHGHSATCVPGFTQRGAVAALNGPQTPIAEMVAAWDRRRRIAVPLLEQIPGVRCPLPEGAFYLFADVRGAGASSLELANRIVEQAHVAVMPGTAFGEAGEGFLRIALTTPDPQLREALERIRRCLQG